MQVILLDDVEKLGLRGEVVDVARGYARNFLLPRRLAEVATPAKVAELRRREERRARHEARTEEEARRVAGRLEDAVLRFDVKAGPTGALFGSVTPTDLADEIWRIHRVRVDRRKIELAEPIKRIGRYEVRIGLFEGVVATVPTHVVPEGGELPPEDEPSVEPPPEEGPEAPVTVTPPHDEAGVDVAPPGQPAAAAADALAREVGSRTLDPAIDAET